MKNPIFYIFIFINAVATTTSGQQTNKPCTTYDCAYKKAENLLNQKGNYQSVLDAIDSAEGYLTDANTKEKEMIKQLRQRLFVAIEKEKEDAKTARGNEQIARERAYNKAKEAEKLTEIANNW